MGRNPKSNNSGSRWRLIWSVGKRKWNTSDRIIQARTRSTSYTTRIFFESIKTPLITKIRMIFEKISVKMAVFM
jgi:hypothetical protein